MQSLEFLENTPRLLFAKMQSMKVLCLLIHHLNQKEQQEEGIGYRRKWEVELLMNYYENSWSI
jgi:hypothetical protein